MLKLHQRYSERMRIRMADGSYKSYQGEVPIDWLGDLIKPGDLVGVKIAPEYEWISDSISDVMPGVKVVAVKLLDDFLDNDVMVDDEIQCRFIKGDMEYILDCKVDDVGIIHPQKMMFEVIKIRRFDNARSGKRYTVNLCGRVTYSENEKAAFITVKNISRTGISIVSREYIGINEEVDVDVVLWKEEVLSIEGRIVRMYKVGKNYKYGIIMENLDKRSKELLEGLIEELEKLEAKDKAQK